MLTVLLDLFLTILSLVDRGGALSVSIDIGSLAGRLLRLLEFLLAHRLQLL